MKVLEITTPFPTKYYNMSPFVKKSIDSVSTKVDVEVVSPKAYVLPFKWFPFHDFAKLPKQEKVGKYIVHYPRYIYPIPSLNSFFKSISYSLVGFFYKLSVNNYIKKNIKKPDIIHANWSYPDGYAAIDLKKCWNIPLVVHVRGTLERVIADKNKNVRKKIIEVLKEADAVVPNNKELKQVCIDLGVKEEKLTVINNGVDTKKFFQQDKNKTRKKLKLPLDKKIILSVGNLQKVKSIDTTIRSIPFILNKNKDILFLIIGDGEEHKNLENLIKELNVGEYVKLLGSKDSKEIPLWMNSSDVLVLSSLSEGRPNVLIEAMACGVPVVSTPVGDVPNIIKDENNGFIVEVNNPEEMSEKIKKMINNTNMTQKLTKNGLLFIKKNKLSWDNHSDELIKLYKKVIQNKKTR